MEEEQGLKGAVQEASKQVRKPKCVRKGTVKRNNMEEEKKGYNLAFTHIRKEYVVSTQYRQCSAITDAPLWYFETIVWEWDKDNNARGKMINQVDSGYDEEMAVESHCKIIQKLINQEPNP